MPKRRTTICDFPGCHEVIPRGRLMCRTHWFQTPRPLREAINAAWREGRYRDWSANILAARAYHATNSPAALAARLTGERT
ncbi:MAG TPA: hypothetical protein VNQ31_09860 [Sphingomonadaceae bacterium]|nr:hypothetical protein [Sphingomonadaceae bacterium]